MKKTKKQIKNEQLLDIYLKKLIEEPKTEPKTAPKKKTKKEAFWGIFE
tara:strand:- start:3978 stop:4121 length:144 start_codon:yes stop_codon:yes gene_type:complete